MSKPLSVAWYSNAPWTGTGYANQTNLFAHALIERGHEVVVRGFYGHHRTTLVHDDIPVLPATNDDTAQDVFVYDYKRLTPDVMLLLYDIWVYNPAILDKVPLTAYSPIDHDPAPPLVIEKLRHCRWVWAMSRFGERKMREAGLDPFYVPHAVDTEVYKPLDRAQSRRKWGVGEKTFLAVCVATNKGYPSRKNLDKLIKAWSFFIQQHPDALLYIHTNTGQESGGLDLLKMVEFYDLPPNSIKFPDQNMLRDGDIHEYMLNRLYDAADVSLLVSQGEGFGIPVIEAQAAGCPVIVTDFTAQSELCGAGYKIPVDVVDDLYYTGGGSEQAWGRPSAILKALEWAYEQRGNETLRKQAREFAMGYDINTVMERYALPAFEIMAQANREHLPRKTLKIKKVIPDGRETAVLPECKAKGHNWTPIGIWDKGYLSFACTRPKCEAELRHDKQADTMEVIPDGFKSEINGIPLDVDDDPICKIIMREVQNSYDLDSIDFQPGDVVIDVGAHVGIVSIYLAKRNPDITVFAYEPIPDNFKRLQRNLEANGLGNVVTHPLAVTSDGRELTLSGSLSSNSGGLSAFTTVNGHSWSSASITLADIMQQTAARARRIRLLKIDCEGAEYEILQSASQDILNRIDHLRGEFHSNDRLRALGYNPEKLIELCKAHVPDVKVTICEIAPYFDLEQIHSIHGHLDDREAQLLYRLASEVPNDGVIVEVGNYQGRSTVCLGKGASISGAKIWAIDSFDDQSGHMQTGLSDRDALNHNLARHGVDGCVTVITGKSLNEVQHWDKPIDLIFIDASHNYEDVKADFEAWSVHVVGKMAFHDTSGHWPGVTKAMNEILAAGKWEIIERADATAVLRRVNVQPA